MGDNNPRKRTAPHVELAGQPVSATKQDKPSERPVEQGLAPSASKSRSSQDGGKGKPSPSERSAPDAEDNAPSKPAPDTSKPQRTRGKRRSIADSGKVVDTDSLSLSGALAAVRAEDDTLTEEEAAERAAAALERQARARQERIEREEAKERKRRRRRIIRRVIFAILTVLVLVFGGLLVAFGIFRWQTYDDVADIQGTWYHEATTVPVTITDDEIVLTDEVAYRYVLDPEAKTILFRFGNMEGAGRYRFSLDRTELVIVDGEFDWMNTFIDDALWTAESLIAEYVTHDEVPVTTGDPQETIFTREKTA